MATITDLTPEEVSNIKSRLARGDYQHRIAADFDLNQGRISEIATGKRLADVPPASMEAEHVPRGGSTGVERTVTRNEPLPPPEQKGQRYRLVDQTKHRRKH